MMISKILYIILTKNYFILVHINVVYNLISLVTNILCFLSYNQLQLGFFKTIIKNIVMIKINSNNNNYNIDVIIILHKIIAIIIM